MKTNENKRRLNKVNEISNNKHEENKCQHKMTKYLETKYGKGKISSKEK